MADVTPSDPRRGTPAPATSLPSLPLFKAPESQPIAAEVNTAPSPGPVVSGTVTLQITQEAWTQLLAMVQEGATVKAAAKQCGIRLRHLEWVLRTVPERYAEYKRAKLLAQRGNWDLELVQDVCNDIALGKSVRKACAERKRDPTDFIRLMFEDEQTREMYELAKKVRAETWADDIVDIADDDSNDTDLMGKGNAAAVKRADLRVNTRLELMGVYNAKKYKRGGGAQQTDVNVNVTVNHAERLEAARQRAKRGPEVIDGEVIK